MNETSRQNDAQSFQYLTFQVGEETFALDVTQVREVLDLSKITKVPRSPDFLKGVINVRGNVVPVVDLRLKFGLPESVASQDTRIVVMEISLDGEMTTLGSLADAVHDVLEMDPADIEKPPRIGSRWNSEFIRGIGKKNDQFIIILDIDKIFSTDELIQVMESSPEVSATPEREAEEEIVE